MLSVAARVESRRVTREEVVDMRGEVLIMDHPNHHHAALPALATAVVSGGELVRRGVAELLRSIPEVGPVAELVAPEELRSPRVPARLDLVVLAAAAVAGLTEAGPLADGTRILVLVDPTTVDLLPGQVSRLADGFLWQPSLSAASLREAVRRTLDGDVPVPPELTHALLSRVDAGRRTPRPVNLTGREREALALLVKGLSNKQIAKRLAISSHGAKRLVTSIMLKLDAPNRTLAAVTAIRAGLVDEDA
jgi:DNA-binding NarL/FixJ family response regulator